MVGIGAINDNYCMTKGVRIDLLKAMDKGTYIRINPPLRAAGKIIKFATHNGRDHEVRHLPCLNFDML